MKRLIKYYGLKKTDPREWTIELLAKGEEFYSRPISSDELGEFLRASCPEIETPRVQKILIQLSKARKISLKSWSWTDAMKKISIRLGEKAFMQELARKTEKQISKNLKNKDFMKEYLQGTEIDMKALAKNASKMLRKRAVAFMIIDEEKAEKEFYKFWRFN